METRPRYESVARLQHVLIRGQIGNWNKRRVYGSSSSSSSETLSIVSQILETLGTRVMRYECIKKRNARYCRKDYWGLVRVDTALVGVREDDLESSKTRFQWLFFKTRSIVSQIDYGNSRDRSHLRVLANATHAFTILSCDQVASRTTSSTSSSARAPGPSSPSSSAPSSARSATPSLNKPPRASF